MSLYGLRNNWIYDVFWMSTNKLKIQHMEIKKITTLNVCENLA